MLKYKESPAAAWSKNGLAGKRIRIELAESIMEFNDELTIFATK